MIRKTEPRTRLRRWLVNRQRRWLGTPAVPQWPKSAWLTSTSLKYLPTGSEYANLRLAVRQRSLRYAPSCDFSVVQYRAVRERWLSTN
ncbi:MAG: hypothetical protein R3C56_20485 [Pirellulaceae bacterium]